MILLRSVIINGILTKYEVYNVYKAKQTDTSCIDQKTDGLKIVTLITCDSINDNFRVVVKAKEVKPKGE